MAKPEYKSQAMCSRFLKWDSIETSGVSVVAEVVLSISTSKNFPIEETEASSVADELSSPVVEELLSLEELQLLEELLSLEETSVEDIFEELVLERACSMCVSVLQKKLKGIKAAINMKRELTAQRLKAQCQVSQA